MSNALTLVEVKDSMPKHLRANITQPMVDALNNLSTDPIVAQNMRENFVSYASVMTEGKFKLDGYVNAVKYVSYKLMGRNSREAYSLTFPTRYQKLLAAGRSDKDISSYVAAYNKGILVNKIFQQTAIPTWVLNQDKVQSAINVLADLMLTANSEKVRSDSATSLLTHLKKPETNHQLELNVNHIDKTGITELKETMAEMAKMQQDMITKGGARTIDIAHQKIKHFEDAEDAEEVK